MTLFLPPNSRRERILIFGTFGSGKSEAVTRIAEKALAPDRTLHITDTERAYEALLDLDDPRIDHTDLALAEWPEYVENAERAVDRGVKGDWWAVDSASHSWEKLQDYALDQGWLSADDDGKLDWQKINREHSRLYNAYLSFPGHLILTARWKELSKPKADGSSRESKQTVQTYSKVGGRPAGQKDLGHIPPHTVIVAGQTRAGEYVMTTVKDRKRKLMVDSPVRDFARDYLVKIAGWTAEDDLEIDLTDDDDVEVED